MIKHISLKHGWFYHYRIHEEKTKNLCNANYNNLTNFLYEMFEDCPEEPFHNGPRGSGLKFELPFNADSHKKSDVSVLAIEGIKWNNYKTAHSNVQIFMLKFDKNTIGVEVPLWAEKYELEEFGDLLEEDGPLSGHIDVLRIGKDGNIWIWDYKPGAKAEKHASLQVFYYALMLSKRTKIPLEKFMCGYFDEKNAFSFNPSNVKLVEALLKES